MSDVSTKTFCELKSESDFQREYSAWKTVYTKNGGYIADEVSFEFIEKDKDGSQGDCPMLCISAQDRNMWVYLSPFQIAYLVELIQNEEEKFIKKAIEVAGEDE